MIEYARPVGHAYSYVAGVQLGQSVKIGLNAGEILATVEEVIWARNMAAPYYLVEYWHDGHLISRRVHAEDCR